MSFFISVCCIFLFMQTVVGLWAYFCFPSLGWKIPAVALPFLLTVITFTTLAYTRSHFGFWHNIAYHLAYIWVGFVFILFSIVSVLAFLQWVSQLFHHSWRSFLVPVSFVLIVIACTAAVYGGWKMPTVKKLTLPLSQSPSFKIAVISDAHLGHGVSVRKWEKALQTIAKEKPDVIFVLGDLFEYGPNPDRYARALAELKTPYGTFGVFGNHEYYTGLNNSLDFYKKANITLLNNQIHTLPNGVEVIGVKDIATARVSPAELNRLLASSSDRKTRILLSHQPLLTKEAAAQGIDLILSGHTHKGQIFPFNFLVKLKYSHIYGWYHLPPKTNLYVTSGMFYWGMPLRLFTSAEIPMIYIQGNE